MQTKPRTLRIPPDDLAEIDRRARSHGLSRTAYMVATALGRDFPETAGEKTRRDLDDLDDRVARLERVTFLQ